MKVLRKVAIAFFVFEFFFISATLHAIAGTLLQNHHLIYEGSFRVPEGNLGGDSTGWTMGSGGQGIAYNPSNNSLVLITQNLYIVEISIPAPVNSADINDLNHASLVQVPRNVVNSQWNNLNLDGSATTGGGDTGDLLVYDGKLVGNAYPHFSTGVDDGVLSHFTAALNWESVGSPYNFSGFQRVGVNPTGLLSNAGWVGGYMCLVPPEWQSRIGYPVLTGNGSLSIIGRSSFGPSIWGFDPNDLNASSVAPAKLFWGYPGDHQTIGGYDDGTGTHYFNNSTAYQGVVFPEGSDSVLIFGRIGRDIDGSGGGCYGTGTSDPSLHLTPVGDGSKYCYDPANSFAKGGHAYPYVNQVWAYDANQIAAVKNGTREFWEITPYSYWTFKLPFTDETSTKTGLKNIGGVAYDPKTQRIFISQMQSDHWADKYEPNPIIHVYHIDLAAANVPIILNIKPK